MIRITAAQEESDPNGWCRLRIEGLGLSDEAVARRLDAVRREELTRLEPQRGQA